MPNTDPEIFSWCPFAGRSNDPEYAQCYNANEEHTPRIFTVQGLCQHVYKRHLSRYREFTRNLEHHIESNRCDINGVRTVAGTATPLSTTHIQIELNAFEATVLSDQRDTGAQDKKTGPIPEEAINTMVEDIHLVQYIKGMLGDTSIWAGTMQDLRLTLAATMSRTRSSTVASPPTGFAFLKTARNLGKSLTRSKPFLEGAGIRFFIPPYNDFNASIVVLQRKEDGEFRSINELHEVIQAQITGTTTEPDDAETATETEIDSPMPEMDMGTDTCTQEDELLINSIRRMVYTIPTWAGTLEDMRSAIREVVVNATGHSEATFLTDLYTLRSRIVKIQNQLEQAHTRVFEVPDTWFCKQIMILQREVDGEFEPVSIESIAKLLPQKQETDTTTAPEDNFIMDCIRQVLDIMPTWAGTFEDLSLDLHRITSNINNEQDHMVMPLALDEFELGGSLIRIKPRFEQDHIRLVRVPRKDFNEQILVLQREVDGKFEPVSKKSVTELLRQIPEMDFVAAHEDKLLVNRIQRVLGDTPLWTGTMQGLHAELSRTLSSESLLPPVRCGFMETPHKLKYHITRIRPLLKTADIRFVTPPHNKFNAPVVILQRKENGKYRPTNELHEVIKAQIAGTSPETDDVETVAEVVRPDIPTPPEPPDETPHTPQTAEYRIQLVVERIQQLLEDTPILAGTPTELHHKISYTVDGELFPKTTSIMGWLLNRSKERLLQKDIQFSRPNARTGRLLVLQKRVGGKFKSIGELRDELILPTSTDATIGNTVRTGVEALPKTVRDKIETEWKEGVPIKDILRRINDQTKTEGITEYKIESYMQWCNSPHPLIICTDINELPKTVRDVIEDDFKRGVPEGAILHRVNDITKGEFRIADTTITKYGARRNIAKPRETQTVAWDPNTTTYIDWGDIVVDNIQFLLRDAVTWTGTPTELHPTVRCEVNGEVFPRTPTMLHKTLNRVAQRLLRQGIQYERLFRPAPLRMRLQRLTDGESKPEDVNPTQEVFCTDPHALPETIRTSFEEDFKRGVPTKEIRHRISDQTDNKFQITEHRMKRYMESRNITQPPTPMTCTWSSDAANYIDWGEHIIERIQKLIENKRSGGTMSWTGTVTELHTIIKYIVDEDIFPAAPNAVESVLNSMKKRLRSHDIYYKRASGKNNTNKINRIKIWTRKWVNPQRETTETIADDFENESGEARYPVEPAEEDMGEAITNIEQEQQITDTATEHSIEVIGVTTIEQSQIKIPADVLSRIGVQEGGRIIYIDDGENIIIKPAKYTA